METHDRDSSTVRLLEGILTEFAERCRRGEEVRVEEYLDRHPQLASELREVLPALRKLNTLAPAASDERAALLPSQLPARIGEYRIVGELGRGGMGVVYQAIQESLNRRVALKVVARPPAEHDAGRERFSREARIAAQLHHTNIVPVFGAGVAENLLFYAMQYIEGESLDRVIAQLREFESDLDADFRWIQSPPPARRRSAPLALRILSGRLAAAGESPSDSGDNPAESGAASAISTASASMRVCPTGHCASVARLGVQVAGALAHAHAHGILHRDIKPSNLILDPAGTVWLTDFGLAQREAEPGLTSAGDLVGTLRYLAPERFRGEVDARADVYALGLVLYELLTFRPAFAETNRQALMEQICGAELPSPRTVRRGIPRDLETIVLKAAAHEPTQRYSSAAALADDLNRFLAGRPVLARPLGPWGRFWRWRRRNPVVAGLASLLLLVLLTSLPIVTWQWRRAERNFQLAAEMERTALAHAADAVHQRDRAEQNFLRARQAVDDYLTTISENNLLDVPTLEPVRVELLSRARAFYEGFVADETRDPQLQCELAATYIRLSQATHDVNGDWLPLFERGLTLLEHAQAAGVPLANSRSWREGVYNTRAGQLTIAEPDRLLPLLERAIAIWTALVARQPEIDGFASDLAGLHLMRGLLHLETPGERPPREDFERSRTIREQLAQRWPDELKFRYGLGESYAMLGIVHLREKQLDEAWELTQRSRELLEPLVRERPAATRMASILAAVQQWLAQIRLQQGRPLEALQEFQRAIDIQRRLAREYPDALQFQLNLCQSYRLLGRALFAARQDELAQQAIDDCSHFLEQRIADYPDRVEYRAELAEVLIEASARSSRAGNPPQAEALARQAVELFVARPAGSSTEARAQFRLGLSLLDQKRAADAVAPLQAAVAVDRKLDSQQDLAGHLMLLGTAFDRSGQRPAAVDAYREVLAIQRAQGAATERLFAVGSSHLATSLEKLGRREEAADALLEQLEEVRAALPDEDPRIHQSLQALIRFHQRHAQWRTLDAILAAHRTFRTERHQIDFADNWSVAIADAAAGEASAADRAARQTGAARREFVAPAIDFYWPNEWSPPALGGCLLTATTELAPDAGTYELCLAGMAGARFFVDDVPILTIEASAPGTLTQSGHDFDGTTHRLRLEQPLADTPSRLRFWLRRPADPVAREGTSDPGPVR
ncbi:MAG: protein kinase [Planctomycetaceae bacterium]|nr:protein kinase [Planctomycetaceae bacterium]